VGYHTDFSRSRPNGTGIDRGSQNIWERLGISPFGSGGLAVPLETRPIPDTGLHIEFDRCRSNAIDMHRPIYIYTAVRRKKIGPLASRLSRSLKVIESDTDRSGTCDFLLVIHSNHGSVSYWVISEINGHFGLKTQILLHPVFNVVVGGLTRRRSTVAVICRLLNLHHTYVNVDHAEIDLTV